MEQLLAARALLETVTPLRDDCGCFCNAACCQGDETDGMVLLPGEAILYQNASWCRILSRSACDILICNGTCPRRERPFEMCIRDRAYPIRFMNEGYYVLMTFDADAEFPAELERNLRIASENVLRFMVTRIPEAGEAVAEEDEAPAADEAVEANEAAE